MHGNPDQSITNVLPLKDLESRVRPELTRWVAVAKTSLSSSVTLFSDLISSRSDVLIRGRCRVVVLLLAFNLLAINLPPLLNHGVSNSCPREKLVRPQAEIPSDIKVRTPSSLEPSS